MVTAWAFDSQIGRFDSSLSCHFNEVSMLISVEVGGFNYHEEELTKEFIERYKLNPIQVFYLAQYEVIKVNNDVYLERVQ